MTESNPVAEDLRFVRQAVEARDRPPSVSDSPLVPWILYTLICVPAYDYAPNWGGRINLVGWLIAAIISSMFARRVAMRSGQFNRAHVARSMMHWYGGVALLIVAVIGLSVTNSAMTELLSGQISTVIVGILYFTAGVNFPEIRFMRWAGPVIVLAAIGIGLMPHFRWTALGLIYAVCLTSPLVARRLMNPSFLPTVQPS